jgi:hypothetical protein
LDNQGASTLCLVTLAESLDFGNQRRCKRRLRASLCQCLGTFRSANHHFQGPAPVDVAQTSSQPLLGRQPVGSSVLVFSPSFCSERQLEGAPILPLFRLNPILPSQEGQFSCKRGAIKP